MQIQRIKAKNFRNYEHLDISFQPHTNILYGKNAQGKTNILEAISVGCTTKSHRSARDEELIHFRYQEAHLELFVQKNKISYDIDMHLRRQGKKGAAINKVPIKKAGELFGVSHIIFFSPENLAIIKNAPSERRRFINMELSQLDPIYVSQLSAYQQALQQRNAVLKEEDVNKMDPAMLEVWEDKLASYGNKIIAQRNIFVQKLNQIMYNIHKSLSGNLEELQITYVPNVAGMSMQEALKRNRKRDMERHITTVGPQRDDLSFFINGKEVKTYGSQGQQRTAALSLKLAEIELVKKEVRETPVLLLDDVLSELDEERQNHLLESIHGVQTILTCTGIDKNLINRLPVEAVYEVSQGKAAKRTPVL